MEEEVGVRLFDRGTRKITLTNERILLRRRAEEILQLVDTTERELVEQEEQVEGKISIGCGEMAAVQMLPELIRTFREKYTRVIHHADKGGGQILVCVAGRGCYQEWGREAVEMKPGDCINIPGGVKHWHGAAPDSWFSHLAVEVPGENGFNEWLEPVDDEQYGVLK